MSGEVLEDLRSPVRRYLGLSTQYLQSIYNIHAAGADQGGSAGAGEQRGDSAEHPRPPRLQRGRRGEHRGQ